VFSRSIPDDPSYGGDDPSYSCLSCAPRGFKGTLRAHKKIVVQQEFAKKVVLTFPLMSIIETTNMPSIVTRLL